MHTQARQVHPLPPPSPPPCASAPGGELSSLPPKHCRPGGPVLPRPTRSPDRLQMYQRKHRSTCSTQGEQHWPTNRKCRYITQPTQRPVHATRRSNALPKHQLQPGTLLCLLALSCSQLSTQPQMLTGQQQRPYLSPAEFPQTLLNTHKIPSCRDRQRWVLAKSSARCPAGRTVQSPPVLLRLNQRSSKAR